MCLGGVELFRGITTPMGWLDKTMAEKAGPENDGPMRKSNHVNQCAALCLGRYFEQCTY